MLGGHDCAIKKQFSNNWLCFQYGNLYNITLGNHEYEKNGDLYSPLTLCQTFYRNGSVYAGNETFEIDAEVDTGMYGYAWFYLCSPHLHKHCCVNNPVGACCVPHLQLVRPVGFDACWALFPSSRLCWILSRSPPVTRGRHVTLSVAFQKVCVQIVCVFFLNPMCAFLFLLHTGHQNLHYSSKVGPQRNV